MRIYQGTVHCFTIMYYLWVKLFFYDYRRINFQFCIINNYNNCYSVYLHKLSLFYTFHTPSINQWQHMVILHQLYHTKIIPISMLGYKFSPLVIIKLHQIFTSSYYLERLWIITQKVTMIKLTACIFNNKYDILWDTYFETTLKWLKYKGMSTVSYIIFKCEKYQVLSYIWIFKTWSQASDKVFIV